MLSAEQQRLLANDGATNDWFGNAVARSNVYTGPEAREDRVKTEAGRAGILHFATHGILNNASPMYSHLVLAQGW
jgi:CHAT domain-containing protein